VVSWNGNTASLQSAVAGTGFTLASTVTNANGAAVAPAKQELTLAVHPAAGATDTISINVGGNTLTFKVKNASNVETLDYTSTTSEANLLTALNAKTITLSVSDGTGKVVITGKDDGSALNLVQFASSSNATPGVTLASTAANTPATAQANPLVTETIAAAPASTTQGSSAWAADNLTGGEGKDTFVFSSGTNDTTKLDTITDLDLGSATVGGQVDNLSFYVANTGVTKALVELTSGQQASVTAAGTLRTAADLVFAAAGTAGNVAKFTYGNDTYIAYNADGGATFGTADFVVKVTGVAGTLDVSDINLLAI
jgi:lysophospholipase L1-like esterase